LSSAAGADGFASGLDAVTLSGMLLAASVFGFFFETTLVSGHTILDTE